MKKNFVVIVDRCGVRRQEGGRGGAVTHKDRGTGHLGEVTRGRKKKRKSYQLIAVLEFVFQREADRRVGHNDAQFRA